MINKHAYLLIVHNNFEILEKLLKLLDHDLNDIYIHVDKKCQSFDFEKYNKLLTKSKIFFIPRIDVRWGHYSQVIVELNLLKEASSKQYAYYHLLSGVDLPIKSQTYIHNYFEKNKNREYIGFIQNHNNYDRVQYYHIYNGRDKFSNLNMIKKIMFIINFLSLNIQKVLKINRFEKYNLEIAKGSNWFSISNQLVNYVVNKYDDIIRLCKFSNCADEIFLQTIFVNSPFYNESYRESQYNSNLRLIDWKRGSPYTFRLDDFDLICQSDALFARKFDEQIDMEIVNKIVDLVSE